MPENYIISIDQSTQGTKALLFDRKGSLLKRVDIKHCQKVDHRGWVSHDPAEIYGNTIKAVRNLVEEAGISKDHVAGIGISNQRETTAAWDRETGIPVTDAIVWQCSRAEGICQRIEEKGYQEMIRCRTGINLSPYFPAAKMAWILEQVKGAKEKAQQGRLCCGTIDSWLVYKLTGGKVFKTDYSNASRTQLFNLYELKWDTEICGIFGIDPSCLAEVCDSDSCFGETDAEGFFNKPVPIHCVLGDSHSALFGQGCLEAGMAKATYGTGSSVMMNIGKKPVLSGHGLVTSLAWSMNGTVDYVLEGNINYTGAVVTWLKDDVKLFQSPSDTEDMCRMAWQDDGLFLVPAFTGLGAPYWNSRAKGALMGISRTTRREEIVRAGVECIAYQINDVVQAMEYDTEIKIRELRADGGPTRNGYLMQFQADITDALVLAPETEELSGIGAAYAAGLALEIYTKEVFGKIGRKTYEPSMELSKRREKQEGWNKAVNAVLHM
ncbi:glycerol kinase GlpK [Clostridium sp. MCC353]|uniref:FGGY-family carbohydrate kinase n=1 Tax=Clostridium sp. MCC353 TaxID=2592646 RepID=UPI001C0244F7|nr:glycerol kinase [Clostridium sp. MCC353]MBT9777489.1 glycerol kinase GlpK [Clostridium sp. MCC353]